MTAQTATSHNNSSTRSTSAIQRLAWLIIVMSFVMFCSMTIAISGGIYYFFVLSTVPLDITMETARGSVELNTDEFSGQVVRSRTGAYPLDSRPVSLRTALQDQAVMTFYALDTEPRIALATFTLENSSTVTLTRANRPRFTWSEGYYRINMQGFQGEADILVSRALDRPFIIQIDTLGNAAYMFDEPGRYSITANDNTIRLITRDGRAVLLSPDRTQNRLASTGEETILRTGLDRPVTTSAPRNLIENGLFAVELSDADVDSDIAPQRWGCFTRYDAPPSGSYSTDLWEGRPSLRLLRGEGATTNGSVGCEQVLAPGRGLDVSPYSYLELQTTFRIGYQSLVNCGVDGSECPMMLFIDYVDINGNDRTWYQGLYYNLDSQSPWPLICQTCGVAYEHQQISENAWYTYESGNLMTRLAPEERPAFIRRVRFYASGHQYDVFVSEVALLVDDDRVIPPSLDMPASTPESP